MGYFEDHIELEYVPEKLKIKEGMLPSYVRMKANERQDIIDRNEMKINEARHNDALLEIGLQIVDRLMDRADDTVTRVLNSLEVKYKQEKPIIMIVNTPVQFDEFKQTFSDAMHQLSAEINDDGTREQYNNPNIKLLRNNGVENKILAGIT